MIDPPSQATGQTAPIDVFAAQEIVKHADLARQNLQELVARFPASKYAADAKVKLDLTNDHLAGKQMEIGRYYLKRGQYAAAINRFRHIIDNYQTTTHVPEALHRMTEAYLSLGIRDEAKNAASILGHNYPGSAWYMDSYVLLTGEDLSPKEDTSWLREIWNTVF